MQDHLAEKRGSLLSIPVQQLEDEVDRFRTEKLLEESALEMLDAEPKKGADFDKAGRDKESSGGQLWCDKYTPKDYGDLLSDEVRACLFVCLYGLEQFFLVR